MEKATHDDIWKGNHPLLTLVLTSSGFSRKPEANEMVHNMQYATMMARLFYLPKPGALPDKKDMDGIWEYYKKYWNTEQGKATKPQFITNYNTYVWYHS